MVKTFPTGLQAHLDDGATTMRFCGSAGHKDSDMLGIIDHNESLL